jgi:hypothetical protein
LFLLLPPAAARTEAAAEPWIDRRADLDKIVEVSFAKKEMRQPKFKTFISPMTPTCTPDFKECFSAPLATEEMNLAGSD